jgi:hypothetical protein
MLAPIFGLVRPGSEDAHVANDEPDIANLGTSVPRTARMWIHLPGGKRNVAASGASDTLSSTGGVGGAG